MSGRTPLTWLLSETSLHSRLTTRIGIHMTLKAEPLIPIQLLLEVTLPTPPPAPAPPPPPPPPPPNELIAHA